MKRASRNAVNSDDEGSRGSSAGKASPSTASSKSKSNSASSYGSDSDVKLKTGRGTRIFRGKRPMLAALSA